MTKEAQKKRTVQNIETVNEELRKKNDGFTIKENIYKQLEKVINRKVCTLPKGFLTPTVENFSQVYV